jgi:hypothetical protein
LRVSQTARATKDNSRQEKISQRKFHGWNVSPFVIAARLTSTSAIGRPV